MASSARLFRVARPTLQRASGNYLSLWGTRTSNASSEWTGAADCGPASQGNDGHRLCTWRAAPGFNTGARAMSDIAKDAVSDPVSDAVKAASAGEDGTPLDGTAPSDGAASISSESSADGDLSGDAGAESPSSGPQLRVFKRKSSEAGPMQIPVVRRMTELMAGNEPEAAVTLFKKWRAGELVGGEDGVTGAGVEEGVVVPFESSPIAYHSMLSATARAFPGDAIAITAILTEMRTSGLVPSQVQYNVALRQMSRGRDSRAVHVIIDSMRKDGIELNGQTYLNAASACMWSGRSIEAIGFLGAIAEHGLEGEVPKEELLGVYEKMIGLCSRLRRFYDALHMARHMKRLGGEPSSQVLGDLLAATLDRVEARHATKVLALLEDAGVKLDEGTMCEALIVAIRRFDADLTKASWAALKHGLGERSPGANSYACYIHALANCNDLEGAFRALSEMSEAHPPSSQYSPRSDVLRPVLYRVARSQQSLDDAFFTVEKMSKEEPGSVKVEAVNVIIQACARLGELTRMLETYEATEGMGLQPDVMTYKLLMGGCLKHRHAHSVPLLAKAMKDKGVEMDLESYCSVVESRIIVGNIYEALEWKAEIEAAGLHFPVGLLRNLAQRAERLGHVEASNLAEEVEARRLAMDAERAGEAA